MSYDSVVVDVEEVGPKQVRAAQTRRRMLDAAYTSFGELGYQGTTIAVVAEEAGAAGPDGVLHVPLESRTAAGGDGRCPHPRSRAASRGQRRTSMSQLVDALAANGPLTVSSTDAVDAIGVVLNMSTFDPFVTDRRWPVDKFKAWAYLTLTQILPRLPQGRAPRADLAATTHRADRHAVAEVIGSSDR